MYVANGCMDVGRRYIHKIYLHNYPKSPHDLSLHRDWRFTLSDSEKGVARG